MNVTIWASNNFNEIHVLSHRLSLWSISDGLDNTLVPSWIADKQLSFINQWWHISPQIQIQNHFCIPASSGLAELTHWGRVTHICVGNLASLGPDNGLSPGQRQAIIWTDAGILLIGPLGTSFSEILIDIHTFSFTKMHLKMSSAKWRPFCLGLNVSIPPLHVMR